jgi:hypothetical protein
VSECERIVLSFGTLYDYMVRKNDEIVALVFDHTRESTNPRRIEIGELKSELHLFPLKLQPEDEFAFAASAKFRVVLRWLTG